MEVQEEEDGSSSALMTLDDNNILITLAVSLDQEIAIRTFFQVNDWPLIEGEKHLEMEEKDSSTRFMTIRVTPEQEAAMEAFFQINNWALIKEAEKDQTVAEIIDNAEETVVQEGVVDEQSLVTTETALEEIADGAIDDISHIQVSTTGSDGQPQVITVYKEGQAQVLPQIVLGDGDGRQNMPSQIIVQEISLPEARNLEQSLIITNPRLVTKRVTPRGTMKPGDKIHKCHVCGKTFKQSPSFNGHYQSHFGNKPHTCEICGTGFTLKAALVAHQSIHTGEKPFQCTVCLKRFRRKDDLLSHIRTHTGEKPYECEICGKKFKYRNQIPKHKRSHTGDRPYKCTHCEKAFTSNIHLKRHERTHTGERPYKCEFCGKAFTQYGHLQAHIRIHTNERPFKCGICGRGFREKKVLKKHESLHTSERPYKCETCGKGFLRQSNMELHSVMHQKGEDGVPRPRPRPKKKKAADAEMREFVENVLSSVVKVETGMQTENLIEEPSIKTENTVAVDNLAAFVDFAVSTQDMNQQQIANTPSGYQDPNVKIDTIPDNLGNQFTLVMPEDGSEGYLITMEPSQEQIVSSEPEVQTLPTAEELNQQVVNATHVYNTSAPVAEEIVESNLITEASNLVDSVLDQAITGEVTDQQNVTSAISGEVNNHQIVKVVIPGEVEQVNASSSSFPVSQDDGLSVSHSVVSKQFETSELNSLAAVTVPNSEIEMHVEKVIDTNSGGKIHIVK